MTRALVVAPDLLFRVRIQGAADQAKATLRYVRTADDLRATLAEPTERFELVVLDLNATGFDPISVVRAVRTSVGTGQARIVGFLSHVQTALAQAAREAGVDAVMSRSEFVQSLPSLFG
ncbi:MAG: hypothetical protein ACYDDF_12135 [Thermoplasmatota archaeon]